MTTTQDLMFGETAGCQLYEYLVSHRSMCIRVNTEGKPPHYLYLSDVLYFSGPTSWKSANFEQADPSECVKLFRKISPSSDFTDEIIFEFWTLYRVRKPDYDILIMCYPNITISPLEPFERRNAAMKDADTRRDT